MSMGRTYAIAELTDPEAGGTPPCPCHTAVVVVRGLVEYVAAVIAASAAWTEFSTRTRNDDIHSGV
jgi:hypothetical protein